jgi:NAD(P)H-nitrite reductase large subunit
MRHLIIGAGPAAVAAAETLRKSAPADEVTIIGAETEPPYSRMAIPYYLIDDIAEAGTHLRKRDNHFANTGIEVIQDTVTAVDSNARTVTLKSGATRHYDRLLVATGSRPLAPPIPGMDSPNVHSCWTLDDARHIHGLAKPGANVLLMGAGFIGCIILEALAASGANLTVVEMGDRMVPRMLDQTAGNLLKQWCENKGVKVHTSTRVESIQANADGTLKASLGNGEVVDANLIVSATGVRPNIEFLEGTGINTEFGVLVDERMMSSVDGIYAAGDVAQALDLSTGTYEVQAIQPTAVEHGRVAALNMAGKNAAHQGSLNMNVLDTVGLISSSFGLWMGVEGGDNSAAVDEGRFRYINLQFKGDVLVGAQSLGHTQHIGVLRGLIQTGAPLGEWKDKLMRNPMQIVEAYLACAQDGARAGQVSTTPLR